MIGKLDFVIREAVDEDRVSILNLLNEVFADQQHSAVVRDDDYYDWKFLDSPFGKSILTVTEYEDEVVGVDNLWAWCLSFKNDLFGAYEACDAVVKKEFRGNRLLQRMREFGVEKAGEAGASLMFNFPNMQSLKSNINFGYQFMGKLNWWIRVIDPIATASIYFNFNSKKLGAADLELDAIEFDVIDLQLLDRLVESYTFSDLITIHRTRDFFKYRYLDHPLRRYGMVSYNDEVAAIYTINFHNGLREMVVVDVIGNKAYIRKLLSGVIKAGKRLNCAFIAMVSDNGLLSNNLFTLGFIKKKEKNFVVFPMLESIKDISTDFSSWNMSASLHDSI